MSTFPWKNTVLVGMAALLGLASLLVTATLSFRLQEKIFLVQAVRDWRRQAALLSTALREAEAAQRMFVITGNESYYARLNAVRDSMPGRWRGLAEAARAVRGVSPDLTVMRAVADEALASLEATAVVRRQDGREAAIALVEAGQSADMLVAVHMQLEAMMEQLEQRTEEETRSLAMAELRGRAASVGAGLVALGMGALGVWQWWVALGHYRRELELAVEKSRAEEMAQDKGDFLAAMSHEVRTPLNTILGMSEQLLAALPDGPLGEKAEAVRTAALAMQRLVNDQLDLSRLEAGRLELVDTAVAMGTELDWLRRLIGPQAETAGVELDLSVAPDVPGALWLDQGRFRQILLNLVANGIQFTPRGGRVRVRLERSESAQGSELVLEVKDSGVGIAPESHARIFQPYVQGRGQRARGPDQGTGLGLAIVQRLVGLMGGTIGLQSRLGAGATFRVHLPLRFPPPAVLESASVGHVSIPRTAGLSPSDPPLSAEAAASLRDILQEMYPTAAATHSTADVQRLADALAALAQSSGNQWLASEAARLRSTSTSFALNELSAALHDLPSRLARLVAPS